VQSNLILNSQKILLIIQRAKQLNYKHPKNSTDHTTLQVHAKEQ
jgi:hypothetical protein